jgi:hypothetical protein
MYQPCSEKSEQRGSMAERKQEGCRGHGSSTASALQPKETASKPLSRSEEKQQKCNTNAECCTGTKTDEEGLARGVSAHGLAASAGAPGAS